MSLNESDTALFEDEPICRSAFMLLGVGPEPDAHELLGSINELVGATVTNQKPMRSNEVPGEDSVLSLAVNEDSMEIHLWVTGIDETVENVVELDSDSSPEQRLMATNSDWALFVLGELRPEALLDDLSSQLQCVDLLCSEVVRQVIDLSAHRLWSVQDFRDLIAIPGCPPISDLYSLHTVTPEEFQASDGWSEPTEEAETGSEEDAIEANAPGFWAHTHGLERFGLPDIEAFDVSATHMHQFRELLDSLVERLVDSPDLLMGIVPMGDEARGTLIDVEEIIALLPYRAAGAHPRVRSQDPSLYGERLALLGVYTDAENNEDVTHWDLTPILENLRQTGKIYRSTHNAARMQKLAKYRLPLLKSVWTDHRRNDWRLLVKIPFVETSNEQREHRWYEIDDLDGYEVQGWPIGHADNTSSADQCSIALSDLSAFMLVTPEGKWDAARLPELARQLAVAG